MMGYSREVVRRPGESEGSYFERQLMEAESGPDCTDFEMMYDMEDTRMNHVRAFFLDLDWEMYTLEWDHEIRPELELIDLCFDEIAPRRYAKPSLMYYPFWIIGKLFNAIFKR
jgi:hypothetical protein